MAYKSLNKIGFLNNNKGKPMLSSLLLSVALSASPAIPNDFSVEKTVTDPRKIRINEQFVTDPRKIRI